MADSSSSAGAYSGPSMKDKGKAKIGERRKRDDDSDEDDQFKNRRVGDDGKDDNITEEEAPGPGSRSCRIEDECLSKTLTAYDVIKENATLHLDDLDALLISGDPHINKRDPRSYAKTMVVYDGINRKYVMVLSKYNSGGRTYYSIGGEWKIFVRANDLRAGDVVTFYEPDDDNIFVVKYFRKPADRNI